MESEAVRNYLMKRGDNMSSATRKKIIDETGLDTVMFIVKENYEGVVLNQYVIGDIPMVMAEYGIENLSYSIPVFPHIAKIPIGKKIGIFEDEYRDHAKYFFSTEKKEIEELFEQRKANFNPEPYYNAQQKLELKIKEEFGADAQRVLDFMETNKDMFYSAFAMVACG